MFFHLYEVRFLNYLDWHCSLVCLIIIVILAQPNCKVSKGQYKNSSSFDLSGIRTHEALYVVMFLPTEPPSNIEVLLFHDDVNVWIGSAI